LPYSHLKLGLAWIVEAELEMGDLDRMKQKERAPRDLRLSVREV
jgi:hypothetical protein